MFRNYLFFDYIVWRNEVVVDWKLRDEGRSEDGVLIRSGKSYVEVYLGRIYSLFEVGEERFDVG